MNDVPAIIGDDMELVSRSIDVYKKILEGFTYIDAGKLFNFKPREIRNIVNEMSAILISIVLESKIVHPFTRQKYPHAYYGKRPNCFGGSLLRRHDLQKEKEFLMQRLLLLEKIVQEEKERQKFRGESNG